MATTEVSDHAPLHDLTAFQRDALAVIASHEDEPLKGLAIKRELDAFYSGEINHGRLYPNLDTLDELGLISKGKLDERTNTYELTPRGRREFHSHIAWLQERADAEVRALQE